MQAWHTHSAAQSRTRGQDHEIRRGSGAKECRVYTWRRRVEHLSAFSHSLAVFTEAWLEVYCSRADPKDCDGRGERLHKRTEKEGSYRLVRAIRPCWCTQCFNISNVCQNVVSVLTKMGNKPKSATSYASCIYLSLETRENKMSYCDFYFCHKFKYCLRFT